MYRKRLFVISGIIFQLKISLRETFFMFFGLVEVPSRYVVHVKRIIMFSTFSINSPRKLKSIQTYDIHENFRLLFLFSVENTLAKSNWEKFESNFCSSSELKSFRVERCNERVNLL